MAVHRKQTNCVWQLTLVRGSSLSLVDLPTFLPPLPLEVTKNIPIISSLSNNHQPFNKVRTQDNLIAPSPSYQIKYTSLTNFKQLALFQNVFPVI